LGPVVGPFEYETGVRGVMSPPLQMLRAAAAGQDVTLAWRLAADWVYSRDVAEGVVSLLAAERLTHRLFNVGSGVVTDMLAWGAELARAYPGWRCRLADPGETPSIVYGLSEERALVATGRLAAETGFTAQYDLPRAVADHVAWQRAVKPTC
jgi:UDP-glucose 4-epimerase